MGRRRIENYLSNYKFQPNNIDFRIVSSKAIQRFKNVQAFQLGQLVNGKFYFTQERRELLLLEYDICTRWLCEVENSIIGSGVVDIDTILLLAEKSHDTMWDVIDKNGGKFDRDFTLIYKEIHTDTHNRLWKMIEDLDTSSIYKFFTALVELIALVMDHALIEIHELNKMMVVTDSLILTETPHRKLLLDKVPRVYVTKLAIEVYSIYNRSITENRVNVYKKFFSFNEIRIRNFSDTKLPPSFLCSIEKIVHIDYKASIN